MAIFNSYVSHYRRVYHMVWGLEAAADVHFDKTISFVTKSVHLVAQPRLVQIKQFKYVQVLYVQGGASKIVMLVYISNNKDL